MNENSQIAGQSKPQFSFVEDEAGYHVDNHGALMGADSKSGKGKNHPSFTLILRKQLPFVFNTVQSSRNQEQDDILKESTNLNTKDAILSVDMRAIKSKHDFELAFPWQIWLLDDTQVIGNDWNVKKHGALVRSGRQFWSVYQQVYDIFDDVNLKNLMIFQGGIEPKWEDKANRGGGRWYFDVSYNTGRGETSRRDCLLKTNYWTQCLEIVLSGCLGPLGDLVVGLILHFKALKYRVSLWIRSCSDFNQVIQLGACLRNYLNLRCQLKFELHSATPLSDAAVESN